MRRVANWFAGAALCMVGCSLFVDVSGLSGGDSCGDAGCDDAGVDGSTISRDGASDEAPGSACPSLHGSPMVLYRGICIDATEVTKGDYVDFLSANPTVKTDGPCAFHTSYAAADDMEALDGSIRGVDWCDARDYCAWAGKRLCGGLDGGAPLPFDDEPTVNAEWYRVCSQGGLVLHPYGSVVTDDLIPGACNLGQDHDAASFPDPPESFPICVVADAGIYDMLGNSDEWVNACVEPDQVIDDAGHTAADAGFSNGYCARVGGAYDDDPTTDCTFAPSWPRQYRFAGIRCCADAP